MTAQLAIGTAQFGMAYGIANEAGQPKLDTVDSILALARAAGIDMLDTATAYGNAESVLGRVGIEGWKVVTKLPAVPEDVDEIEDWMKLQVTSSLSRLGIGRLHGLLLHAPFQMRGPRAETIARALEGIRDRGLATRVGVSIQHPDKDLPAVLSHMAPGVIQSPFNLLDDALVERGWAARLRGMGCEVHTRSTFLQGLLVMKASSRPAWFDQWAGHWQVWEGWLSKNGLSAIEASVRFGRAQSEVDYAVLGVDSVQQLDTLLKVGAEPLPSRPCWPSPPDLELITPSQWPLR